MAGRVFAPSARIFTRALGETVTWTPAGGSPVEIRGVFTREYMDGLEAGEMEVESYRPAVSVQAADVPNAAQGDAVTRDGTDYTVVNVRPDGFGMVALILHEA